MIMLQRLVARCLRAHGSIRFQSDSAASNVQVQAKYNLKEFFEEEKNMGVAELRPKDRPGRSWSLDELRLKSNSDLHKLW
jgi:hypothetical protein